MVSTFFHDAIKALERQVDEGRMNGFYLGEPWSDNGSPGVARIARSNEVSSALNLFRGLTRTETMLVRIANVDGGIYKETADFLDHWCALNGVIFRASYEYDGGGMSSWYRVTIKPIEG